MSTSPFTNPTSFLMAKKSLLIWILAEDGAVIMSFGSLLPYQIYTDSDFLHLSNISPNDSLK